MLPGQVTTVDAGPAACLLHLRGHCRGKQVGPSQTSITLGHVAKKQENHSQTKILKLCAAFTGAGSRWDSGSRVQVAVLPSGPKRAYRHPECQGSCILPTKETKAQNGEEIPSRESALPTRASFSKNFLPMMQAGPKHQACSYRLDEKQRLTRPGQLGSLREIHT